MIRTLFTEELRLLTFRRAGSEIFDRWKAFLAFGLVLAWLAGVGRYWDNPRAGLWQSLGLGSVVYVFVLAAVIWAVVFPFRPCHWRYRNVLAFVTLTSPPAFLYAIPVEQFMPMDQAGATNAWFLAIVSCWRVGLLFAFLYRVAGLSAGNVIVASLLPLALTVVVLTLLNLEHVVFNIMGGITPEQRTANDDSYGILITISLLSFMASPILLIAYVIGVYRAWTDA